MEAPEVEFTTLGMFIIDQIHYGPPQDRKCVDNVIGGGGTYSILGARLFSPPPLSQNLSWIVHTGHDFPPTCLNQLTALNTSLILRSTPERATTRGWNSYGPDDQRAFSYLTPKKRVEVEDLVNEGLLSRSGAIKAVHMICSPERVVGICGEIDKVLGPEGVHVRPMMFWEPVPDLCGPEYKEEMLEALRLVDMISPNHTELASFFGIHDPSSAENPETITHLASRLVSAGIGKSGDGAVVVRAGKRGCLVVTKREAVWLPAYYSSSSSSSSSPLENNRKPAATEEEEEHRVKGEGAEGNHPKVQDPTGGGNAFIGGLAIGLVRMPGNILFAAAMGNIAASFVIEQVGIPVLGKSDEVEGSGGETWNGVCVMERLREYIERVREEVGICLVGDVGDRV